MATAGKGGSVSLDGGTSDLAEIQEWNIDENVDLQEAASFGDDHQHHTVGLKDTPGSFSGLFNTAQISETTPGSAIATLRLEISDGVYIESDAIISSRSVSNVVDGQAEIDIDFEFQSEGTWTTT